MRVHAVALARSGLRLWRHIST